MENTHRQLIQFMLKKGITSIKEAIHLCNKVSDAKVDDGNLKQMIAIINREISKQHFKIVFTTCEVKNENVLVWINTKSDDISKKQTAFKPIHFEYFYKILDEILNSPDFKIPSIAVLNLTSDLTTSLSIENGQIVLQMWIYGGYYVQSGEFICLGPRLIQEFNSYLKSQYSEQLCKLCSELIFIGEKCNHCNQKLHTYCMNIYLKNQNNCPQCSHRWTGSEEVNGTQEIENTNTSTDSD